ncbi:11891_t:CDS:2 [Cetraspora pellucida]|uniref:11891_t:CDS:1 n=1 Tax=Cetraspora pellucida TaxID=1433469 RepID=A0ACA9JWZ3_9GLOM|nr:11891_t:CDS:2 [Cetraspora pellucida]
MEIRTKLLELVNALIEGKESQEQLENRNKDLEEKLKEGGLNEVERELLEIAEMPIGTDRSFFGDSKKMIEPKELKKMLQADYQAIKKRLIDLADKELEVQQNQQKITELTQKRDQLQKDLDLATKTKEELAEELQKEKGWWAGFSKEQTKEIFEKGSQAGVRPQDGAFIENEEEFKELRDNYRYFGTCKEFALKTLSNSQNLDQEFLQELTLYKMFRSSVSQMVPCYGISKDTEGNYIMVMDKPINTKEITTRLQTLQLSQPVEAVEIPEDYGETSLQAQIEIPPKNN